MPSIFDVSSPSVKSGKSLKSKTDITAGCRIASCRPLIAPPSRPSSSCRASWLLHHLLPSSHCAALLLSCHASCLSPSPSCATLSSSSSRQLVASSPLLVLSLHPASPSHPLVAPAGCCVHNVRHHHRRRVACRRQTQTKQCSRSSPSSACSNPAVTRMTKRPSQLSLSTCRATLPNSNDATPRCPNVCSDTAAKLK